MLYLDIFDKEYVENTPKTGIHIPTEINYLRRLYIFNNNNIVNYYRKRNFAVKNNHILSRLLEHIPLLLNYDNYRYLEYISNKLVYLAKHFKLTSELEKGIVHRGYFFGNGGEEIIIASHELFDINYVVNNWKDAKSVRVITTDRDDTKLLLPLGKNDGCKNILSVILINVPMLALQYREFMKEQQINSEILLTKNNFIIKYVLPNMMSDVIDHIFLNRVIEAFYGEKSYEPNYHHRFKIFEPYTQLSKYSINTNKTLKSKKIDFINILRNIQLIFNEDASKLLVLPDIGYTRQIRWALLVSRLKYMSFLVDVNKDKKLNNHYLNDWKRLIKRLEQDKSLEDMFSYETEIYLQHFIDNIKNFKF